MVTELVTKTFFFTIEFSTVPSQTIELTSKSQLRIRKALENRTNMEDDRVAILESQLAQAKLIAEEADKKYEEVQPQDINTRFEYFDFSITNCMEKSRFSMRVREFRAVRFCVFFSFRYLQPEPACTYNFFFF